MTSVLIDKNRDTRPAWSPSELRDVDEVQTIKSFFDSTSPFLKNSPKLDLPLERSVDRAASMRYALPTEFEIEMIVRGTHPQSGSVAYSLDDLIAKFLSMTGGKHGVAGKIREVAARKCEIAEDPDSHHCLRWK